MTHLLYLWVISVYSCRIMVLDEIDQLDSKNQEILYTIFEWPALTKSRLILIGKFVLLQCDSIQHVCSVCFYLILQSINPLFTTSGNYLGHSLGLYISIPIPGNFGYQIWKILSKITILGNLWGENTLDIWLVIIINLWIPSYPNCIHVY